GRAGFQERVHRLWVSEEPVGCAGAARVAAVSVAGHSAMALDVGYAARRLMAAAAREQTAEDSGRDPLCHERQHELVLVEFRGGRSIAISRNCAGRSLRD